MYKSIIITDEFFVSGDTKAMKILLVDDEQLIVDGLKKIISRQFPEVEPYGFTDPIRALDEMKNELPTLLITDIRMPEMTGLQLIQQAKEIGVRNCAVLTGLDDVPLLQESIRLQVCDYLIKPVNKEELYSLIRRIQEQIARESMEQTNVLAENFCSGAWTDEQVARELGARMKRSDCALQEFILMSGRELPFWEICDKAIAVVLRKWTDEEFGTMLRQLPVVKKTTSPEIQKVLAEIRANYAQDLTVTQMGETTHLQPNYLTTLFRKETGKGFIQYLNQYRIEEACRMMLTNPDCPLQDVAEACGFQSPRYFFTVFKKLTDSTPGAFREKMEAAGFIRS